MKPICKPVVNTQFEGLNGLQRSTECIRYTILCLEHWLSPDGRIREWLRRNLLLGAWLIVPSIFVMPVIGLILWQLTGWLSMLSGRFIILPLFMFIVIKSVLAFLKR